MISRRLLNEGEHVVVSMRTHWKALILPTLVAVLCVVAAALVAALDVVAAVRYVGWVVLLVVFVWWAVTPYLRWGTSSYTLTSRRLITRHGIFTRTGHDIPLNRISDVSYEHGIIDRMLGCGTLIISDASTHGRVVLPDVPDVEESQLKLSNLLFGAPGDHPRQGRGDDGS